MQFSRIFASVVDAVRGFNVGLTFNMLALQDDAIHRGAAPSTLETRISQSAISLVLGQRLSQLLASFRWMRTSVLITPFLLATPFLINLWPRADADNVFYNAIKTRLQRLSEGLKAHWNPLAKLMGYGLVIPYWLVDNLPHIHNRKVIQFLHQMDKYYFSVGYLLILASYAGLFFAGEAVLVTAAAATLALGALDYFNYLPARIKNPLRKWGMDIVSIGACFFGGMIEFIPAVLYLGFRFGHLLAHIGVFEKLNTMLDSVLEQVLPQVMVDSDKPHTPQFDFRCHTSQFEQSVLDLYNTPCKIDPKHIKNESHLTPPNVDVDVAEYLTLFDTIEWDESTRRMVEANRQRDWRLKRARAEGLLDPLPASPELRLEQDIAYLRENISVMIERYKKSDFQSIRIDRVELLQRFIRAILVQLKQYQSAAQDLNLTAQERARNLNTFKDQMIVIGFEMGNYCAPGNIEVMQKLYRENLRVAGVGSLADNLHNILQLERERFFQQAYYKYWVMRMLSDVSDLHAYNRAALTFAPEFGLPGIDNEVEDNQVPPLLKKFFSKISFIEISYWRQVRWVQLSWQIETAMNTDLLTIKMVQDWYNDFIDTHVYGTQDDKDELKMDQPYTVEWHGQVPMYKLKPQMLRLMMLDAGILQLPATHVYRPAEVIPEAPVVEPTLASPIPAPLQFSQAFQQPMQFGQVRPPVLIPNQGLVGLAGQAPVALSQPVANNIASSRSKRAAASGPKRYT